MLRQLSLMVAAVVSFALPAASEGFGAIPVARTSISPFVGGDSPTLAQLVDRIECYSWRRARLDRALLGTTRRPGWSHMRQGLWVQSEGLVRYEETHIRPHIDAETQEVLVETYWPEGFLPPEGQADPRTQLCVAFRFSEERLSLR